MSNYSTLQEHRAMVFDDQRNDLYAKAIKKAVSKDSVVLDLGAGLGLHGFIAAQAGAKRVYLVEPSAIIEVTRQLINANKMSTQIECISGGIEEVKLAEKADLIISVFTGNFLLTEDLLPSLFHARDRYLKPGGKLIPDRAVMTVVPVTATTSYEKHVTAWNKSSQGMAFDLARGFAANQLYSEASGQNQIEFLSEPADLLEIDFMTATESSCHSRVDVEITRDGLCHGWLGWFRMRLGDHWLSTSPEDKKTHWRQLFLPLAEPVRVKKNSVIHFELDRPEFGEWTWSTEYDGRKQRQSTFLAQPTTPAALQRKSDSHKPRISLKGTAANEVISRFKGNQSTAEIVDYIATKYDMLFPNRKLADNFVKNLVDQHCL